jgi:hypothetical protein
MQSRINAVTQYFYTTLLQQNSNNTVVQYRSNAVIQ